MSCLSVNRIIRVGFSALCEERPDYFGIVGGGKIHLLVRGEEACQMVFAVKTGRVAGGVEYPFFSNVIFGDSKVFACFCLHD